jgi:hypothetical protein
MKFKRVFLIVLLGLITLTTLFTACTENIEQASKKESLPFTYAAYSFTDIIEEDIVFMHTKAEADAFGTAHGAKMGDGFLNEIAQCDDMFFEQNTLIWVNAGANERVIKLVLKSIERTSSGEDTTYSIHIHKKSVYGDYAWPDEYTGETGFLIRISGKYAMSKHNTTVVRTS